MDRIPCASELKDLLRKWNKGIFILSLNVSVHMDNNKRFVLILDFPLKYNIVFLSSANLQVKLKSKSTNAVYLSALKFNITSSHDKKLSISWTYGLSGLGL